MSERALPARVESWLELRPSPPRPTPSYRQVEEAVRRIGGSGFTRKELTRLRDAVHQEFEARGLAEPDFFQVAAAAHSHVPVGPVRGFIYAIRCGEFVRIGRSQTPRNRLRYWSRVLPQKPEPVMRLEVDDYVRAETTLHRRFATKRSNNEWFRLDEDDIALLRALDPAFYTRDAVAPPGVSP
jgi:hypothetical protein